MLSNCTKSCLWKTSIFFLRFCYYPKLIVVQKKYLLHVHQRVLFRGKVVSFLQVNGCLYSFKAMYVRFSCHSMSVSVSSNVPRYLHFLQSFFCVLLIVCCIVFVSFIVNGFNLILEQYFSSICL